MPAKLFAMSVPVTKQDSRAWKVAQWIALVVAVIGGAAGVVSLLIQWHSDAVQEATRPSANILSIAKTDVDPSATKPYKIGLRKVPIAFEFRPGDTGEQPVIIVHSGGVRGSNEYYPLNIDRLSHNCPEGPLVYCGSILVGSENDKGVTFSVSIYGVPAQIEGDVKLVVDANEGPGGSWLDLPAELGEPLSVVTVSRTK